MAFIAAAFGDISIRLCSKGSGDSSSETRSIGLSSRCGRLFLVWIGLLLVTTTLDGPAAGGEAGRMGGKKLFGLRASFSGGKCLLVVTCCVGG